MNEENTRKLLTDFDRLFRGRAEPETQTRMCDGVACGDGWFDLISQLCVDITEHARKVGLDPKAVQVKEKFGCLCFYVHKGDEMIQDLCVEASKRSMMVCDSCGGPGTTQASKDWWYRTTCPDCRRESAKIHALLRKSPQSKAWPFQRKYLQKRLAMNETNRKGLWPWNRGRRKGYSNSYAGRIKNSSIAQGSGNII